MDPFANERGVVALSADISTDTSEVSATQRLRYVIVLGALTALGPFTIDLYLPAFPAVAAALHSSASAIQATLAATTVGLAVGQLIMGPWSDVVGRKRPLILAAAIHVAASLACAVAPNVEFLIASRFLMGAAAAAGGVVSLALVRDLFAGRPMLRMLSSLAIVNGLAPIIAPILGSQLLIWLNWRGIFILLACYGAAVGIASALWVAESLAPERRSPTSIRTVLSRMRGLLSDRRYLGFCLTGGFIWGGQFTYLASSPFLFQGVYDFSVVQYGLLFAVNALGFVAGIQVGGRLSTRIPPQWILVSATTILVLSAMIITGGALIGGGLAAVVVPLWFSIATVGLSIPGIQTLALEPYGHEAGTAASLLGAANFGVAGVVTPLVGLIITPNALGMGAIMLACAATACIMLWVLVRPRSVPALSH